VHALGLEREVIELGRRIEPPDDLEHAAGRSTGPCRAFEEGVVVGFSWHKPPTDD
jgi:hypothetical protein